MAVVISHSVHSAVLARDDHGRIRGEEPRGAEEESEGECSEVVSVGRGHCKRLRFSTQYRLCAFSFFYVVTVSVYINAEKKCSEEAFALS